MFLSDNSLMKCENSFIPETYNRLEIIVRDFNSVSNRAELNLSDNDKISAEVMYELCKSYMAEYERLYPELEPSRDGPSNLTWVKGW